MFSYVDKDGNKEINEADRYIIGDPNPDIYGNINMKFHFGQNWTLATNFNYCLGNDVYNYQRSVLEGGSNFINQTKAMNRHWTAEGQVTDIPQIVYQDPMGNSRFSDRWIEDGSFLKLKTLTLSYQVPLGENIPLLRGVEVYATGNNLFTVTKYLGYDPESNLSQNPLYYGIDTGATPQAASVLFGLRIAL